jgi:hypothetical protein
MNNNHSRIQTLLSVIRKNWAEAVCGLRRAESDLTMRTSELRQTKRDIAAVQSALVLGPTPGRVRADSLQMDAFSRERERVRLEHFREREKDLTQKVENATVRVDDAKRAVIKTHKALKLLKN